MERELRLADQKNWGRQEGMLLGQGARKRVGRLLLDEKPGWAMWDWLGKGTRTGVRNQRWKRKEG